MSLLNFIDISEELSQMAKAPATTKATVDNITEALQKLGYIAIGKDFDFSKAKAKTFYFIPPSARGKEILLYIPESYAKTQRPMVLSDLAKKLTKFKATFKPQFGGTTRPAVSFTGSEIFINGKMIAAKGGKGNKGNEFEDKMLSDFEKYIDGGYPFTSKNYNYPEFMNEFINMLAKTKEKIKSVSKVGQENTPRPLGISGDQLYVSVRGAGRSTKIGAALSDINVVTNKRTMHLSLKYGSTVTFMNSGVGKFFPRDKFVKGKQADFSDLPHAMAIFRTFGIDPVKFQKVFTNYVEPQPGEKKRKSEKEIVEFKPDKLKMENLIKTAIGYDYYLLHLDNKNHIHIQEMTESYLKTASTLASDTIQIYYPTKGSAKRVDMIVMTKKFKLKWNIRNKQSGIAPSHIMCDYEFL